MSASVCRSGGGDVWCPKVEGGSGARKSRIGNSFPKNILFSRRLRICSEDNS